MNQALSTFEKVSPERAEVTISTEAYRSNITQIRSELSSNTQLWSVVKADAYGHGMELLANEALASGVERLCVATLSEAIHLREHARISAPLLIMGPLDGLEILQAIKLDISFTVLHDDMLKTVVQLSQSGVLNQLATARVHLKVDTGMGRWGIPYNQALPACDRLLELPGVEFEGIMTHFATADQIHSGFMYKQLERFKRVVADIRPRVPNIIAHAANSAAMLRDKDTHLDAVRCGVATFGMSPFVERSADELRLKPVLSLRSRVSDIRHLKPGESVGYGRLFIADRPVTIAEVPIGYADGVRRALGGDGTDNGSVLVHQKRCPIVGAISMDHLCVLVDDEVERGDVVTIIGSADGLKITAEDHAAWAKTINYEITCAIADEPRLARARE